MNWSCLQKNNGGCNIFWTTSFLVFVRFIFKRKLENVSKSKKVHVTSGSFSQLKPSRGFGMWFSLPAEVQTWSQWDVSLDRFWSGKVEAKDTGIDCWRESGCETMPSALLRSDSGGAWRWPHVLLWFCCVYQINSALFCLTFWARMQKSAEFSMKDRKQRMKAECELPSEQRECLCVRQK